MAEYEKKIPIPSNLFGFKPENPYNTNSSRQSELYALPNVTSIEEIHPAYRIALNERAGKESLKERAEEEGNSRVGNSNPQEKDGSGVWGAEAEDRNLTDRLNHYQWTRVALVAESMGLTNAARHMRHYLGNTGSLLTVDVDNMLRDIRDFAEVFRTEEVVAQLAVNDRISSLGKISKPTSFSLNKAPIDIFSVSQYASKDWYYALGSFLHGYSANVSVSPTAEGNLNVEMAFTLHISDIYNWDKGKAAPIAGIPVKDEQLGRLHRVGLAREYPIKGNSTTVFTTWQYDASERPEYPDNGVPISSQRDGNRNDLGRQRGRHFENIRGSEGSQR